VPDETTHRYTLTVELDGRAEADLTVLAEYSGRSKEAVLREALLGGLAVTSWTTTFRFKARGGPCPVSGCWVA